jgi:acetylornithine/N-succinyldiaminopimelate aminotransferase
MEEIAGEYEKYVIPTYGRFNLDLDRGTGCRVWDFHGREYLDFGAGIAVCSLGHSHPEVTSAVAAQAGRLVHTSNLYRTAPQARLARELVEITGPGKIFFCNSGAEANEGLIKLARRFGSATGRHEILTFNGSFHGRTMAGISATAQEKVKKGFGPLLPGFRHLPFGDLAAVREAVGPETVAILIEPVQGEGGIHIARAEFLRGLREICNDRGLLLLFDEIQCGLGRTGAWCGWKSMAPELQPDGVSWAKGIANGFPLGAFWISSNAPDSQGPLCNLLGPGSHGTTFGGNPVSCAAALKVLEIIARDGLVAQAVVLGRELADSLSAASLPGVVEVRSLGLMAGVQLDPTAFPEDGRPPALQAVLAAMAEGLLVIPAGETVVRFLPPLNVTREEIAEAVTKFATALGKSAKS